MSLPPPLPDEPPAQIRALDDADILARELVEIVAAHLAARGVGRGRDRSVEACRRAVVNIRAAVEQVEADMEMVRGNTDRLALAFGGGVIAPTDPAARRMREPGRASAPPSPPLR